MTTKAPPKPTPTSTTFSAQSTTPPPPHGRSRWPRRRLLHRRRYLEHAQAAGQAALRQRPVPASLNDAEADDHPRAAKNRAADNTSPPTARQLRRSPRLRRHQHRLPPPRRNLPDRPPGQYWSPEPASMTLIRHLHRPARQPVHPCAASSPRRSSRSTQRENAGVAPASGTILFDSGRAKRFFGLHVDFLGDRSPLGPGSTPLKPQPCCPQRPRRQTRQPSPHRLLVPTIDLVSTQGHRRTIDILRNAGNGIEANETLLARTRHLRRGDSEGYRQETDPASGLVTSLYGPGRTPTSAPNLKTCSTPWSSTCRTPRPLLHRRNRPRIFRRSQRLRSRQRPSPGNRGG